MKQKFFWLKLTGVALLLHIVLIVLSIVEVAVYSYVVNPGHDEKFYRHHAEQSGPWISGLFGSLFTFLIVRRFIQRNQQHHLTYTIAFPLAYIILDVLMLLAFRINWNEHLPIFLTANGAKIIASLLAYFKFKHTRDKRQRNF